MESASVRPIKAVLFDYDDTLANTEAARLDAMARTLAEVGVASPTADALVAEFAGPLRGVPLQVSMERFESRLGTSFGLTSIYRKLYWGKAPGLITTYPGVPEMLDSLRDMGLLLGVVTSKLRRAMIDGRVAGVEVELEELGLIDYFPFRIGVNDVRQPKPDPEGIHTLLGSMGVHAGEALVVGDSVADMAAGRTAGCRCSAAIWGIPDGNTTFGEIQPDAIATRPHDIVEQIQRISLEIAGESTRSFEHSSS